MIRGSPSTPKPQITFSGRKTSTSAPVKKSKATPSTSRGEDTDLTARLGAIRERRKGLEKQYAASPWGKGKSKG